MGRGGEGKRAEAGAVLEAGHRCRCSPAPQHFSFSTSSHGLCCRPISQGPAPSTPHTLVTLPVVRPQAPSLLSVFHAVQTWWLRTAAFSSLSPSPLPTGALEPAWARNLCKHQPSWMLRAWGLHKPWEAELGVLGLLFSPETALMGAVCSQVLWRPLKRCSQLVSFFSPPGKCYLKKFSHVTA